MKNFTVLCFIACCFLSFNAQSQCNATIGYQHNPNSIGDDFWVTNYYGDTANTDFTWQFCDGTADAGISIVHALPPAGGFFPNCVVCVTIYDRNSTCTYTTCDTIVGNGIPNNNCAAYATFTNVDSLYTFFASTTGGNPVVYEWSVNGTPAGTSASFTIVLDSTNAINGGTMVCVDITDANGCVSSDCIIVTNNNSNPNGGFIPCQAYFEIGPDTGINSGGQPGYYIGNNRSSGNYGSNVLWDFGDGTTSADPYPVHNYPAPGNYIVCLTVGTAGTNCYDTYCDSSFYVLKTEGGLMSHLSFATATGIRDVAENTTLRLFPNPVTNELNWLSENKVEQVRVYDLSGRKVLDAKPTGTKINLAKLSAGAYFIQAVGKEGKGMGVSRFVKE